MARLSREMKRQIQMVLDDKFSDAPEITEAVYTKWAVQDALERDSRNENGCPTLYSYIQSQKISPVTRTMQSLEDMINLKEEVLDERTGQTLGGQV